MLAQDAGWGVGARDIPGAVLSGLTSGSAFQNGEDRQGCSSVVEALV